MQKLMKASSEDRDTFFKLIKTQCTASTTTTQELLVDGILRTSEEEICQGWKEHFGKLATPQDNNTYDTKYQQLVESDIKTIRQIIETYDTEPIQISVEQVRKAIGKLNTGKAPDADGITAEHLKNAGILLAGSITQIMNGIMKVQIIPERLKLGTLTPIWKKNEKNIPTNYRGITVISVLGKILESILKEELVPVITRKQSKFQRGFTKSTSPLNASLIMQEMILDSQQANKTLYVAYLDAKAAFDVVSHSSLLRKLYLSGISNALWTMIADTFRCASSVVKWNGLLSEPFEILQGVRQGGILSADEYKLYVNDLLLTLEGTSHGARIGNITCAAPTCADDVALMAHTREDLQCMLDICHNYSRMERYQLQPTKSMVMIFNPKTPTEVLQENSPFTLGEDQVPVVSKATHIGLIRDTDNTGKKSTLKNNVTKARKALYSLMGAGLHGTNGLRPALVIHLFTIYIIPILTYGLEIFLPSDNELKETTVFYEKTIKHLLSLPNNCARPAIYILSGLNPLQRLIHARALSLFGSIARNAESIEHHLAARQLTMKQPKDNSWFIKVKNILAVYDLPSALDLLDNPPQKNSG